MSADKYRRSGRSLFFEPDLDFLFGELDSHCGLKSLGVSGVEKAYIDSGRSRSGNENPAATVKVSKQAALADEVSYTDGAVRAFGRGRRVRARLMSLPLFVQSLLAEWYTPRQWSAVDRKFELSEITAAHLAYRNTK